MTVSKVLVALSILIITILALTSPGVGATKNNQNTTDVINKSGVYPTMHVDSDLVCQAFFNAGIKCPGCDGNKSKPKYKQTVYLYDRINITKAFNNTILVTISADEKQPEPRIQYTYFASVSRDNKNGVTEELWVVIAPNIKAIKINPKTGIPLN